MYLTAEVPSSLINEVPVYTDSSLVVLGDNELSRVVGGVSGPNGGWEAAGPNGGWTD